MSRGETNWYFGGRETIQIDDSCKLSQTVTEKFVAEIYMIIIPLQILPDDLTRNVDINKNGRGEEKRREKEMFLHSGRIKHKSS